MNRQQAEAILPIVQAMAEGKTIQRRYGNNEWKDTANIDEANLLAHPDDYRIAPDPIYRPFRNGEECWQEMLKHQPFGWVKEEGRCNQILRVENDEVGTTEAYHTYIAAVDSLTFTDGTPFGIKKED